MPVRSYGGAGASTSTAGPVTAADVVWGPNFGSTRQFAEDELLSANYNLASTGLLTEEELLRLTGTDQIYRLIEEGLLSRTQIAQVTRALTEEAHVSALSDAITVSSLVEDGSVSLPEYSPTYPIIQESSYKAMLLTLFPTAVREEEVLSRTADAVYLQQATEEESFVAFVPQPRYPLNEESLIRPSSYEATYPTAFRHEGRFTLRGEQTYSPLLEEQDMLPVYGPSYSMSTCEQSFGVPAVALGVDRLTFEEEVARMTQVTYTNVAPKQEGDFVLAQLLLFFSSSGSFTQPNNTSLYDANVWAAGGGGGTGGGAGGGNGGGGGGQSFSSGLVATPGTTVTVTIGPASTGNGLKSWIGSSVNLLARPGTRGGDGGGTTGLGGTTATAVGQLKFKGGNGSTSVSLQGGGGGGGAGTTTPGASVVGSTAGGAGGLLSGGAGGRGGNAAAAGAAGAIVGGGGGGGGSLTTGASGARGAAAITVFLPV